MQGLYYVEISRGLDGQVTVEKYFSKEEMKTYIDREGVTHKIHQVSERFDLNSLVCKNMLFDYMEEIGCLQEFKLASANLKGKQWSTDRGREYELIYGRYGKLSAIYTDTKNSNRLVNQKYSKKRIDREVPTSLAELCVKKCVKSVKRTVRKAMNINSLKNVPGVKIG